MYHKDFNYKEHGFVGHLAEPDGGSDEAVIVIMGGEQSLLPGIKFAEFSGDITKTTSIWIHLNHLKLSLEFSTITIMVNLQVGLEKMNTKAFRRKKGKSTVSLEGGFLH